MTRSRAKYPCIKLDCITQQLNHRKIPEHGTAKLEYKECHSSEKNKAEPSTTATEPTQQVEAWNSERGISETSPIRINEEHQHHSSHLPGSIVKSPNQSNLSPTHSSDNESDSLNTGDKATDITCDYSHRSDRWTGAVYPNNKAASARTELKKIQLIDPPNSKLYNKNYRDQ